MGKLLNKLVHGIVPSWLTKIKASNASPKKLLPFFKGSSHFFSNKSSAMSSSSPRSPTSTELLALMDKDNYSQSEEDEEAPTKANMEISATPTPSSTSIMEESHHDDDHHHQHLDDDHRQYLDGHHQHHNKQRHYYQGYHEHELLRSKRKSQCLHEGEEDHGSSKRWKREKGAMNSELPQCLCEIVGNGSAVVKYCEDPHLAFWESMVEMIVGNGLWEMGNLEFLLYCYLSLNDPNLHDTIQISFLKVLKDLERTT